jgi:RND family efflux transporter MFP subunit
MQFSKKILIISSIIIVIIAISVVWLMRSGWRISKEEQEDSSSSAVEETLSSSAIPVPVEAALVERGKLIQRIVTNGIAKAVRKVVFQAEVEGMLMSLKVKDGQIVRANDLLAKIDDTDYKLEVATAEEARIKALADYALMQLSESSLTPSKASEKDTKIISNAKTKWEEAEENYKKGLISKRELEHIRKEYDLAKIMAGLSREEVASSQVGLKRAEIALEKAKRNLEKTEIRAPFSGIVTDVEAVEGEMMNRGKSLFKLVDLSTIKLEAKVLESEIGLIDIAREAWVVFPAYPDKSFVGKISAISPIVDSDTKTCTVMIHLANPEKLVKDGMYAQVRIDSQIFENRLIVPQEAILEREGRKLIFLIENKRSKWIYIRTGVENEEYAEILSESEGGLLMVKEGDLVITSGHYTLAHDALVRVVNQSELNLK